MSEAPHTLVVDAKPAPGDASDGSGTAMGRIALPIGAAGLLAKLVSPLAGLGGLAVAVIVLVAMRKPNEGRTILAVVEGQLEIRRERAKAPVAVLPLDDVLDVSIDREVQRAGTTTKERVWLVLERPPPADPIFVPDARITAIEGQEWFAKVRTFLRAHGWVPKDERVDRA